MLDRDLATIYGIETKSLNLSVKRNIRRFPPDFMFRLTRQEVDSLTVSEIGQDISNTFLRFKNETSKRQGGVRYLPYAFTEQGVAMLSGVLNSERAIQMNIAIMRAFDE